MRETYLSGIADFEETGTTIEDYWVGVSMEVDGFGGVGIPMGGSAISSRVSQRCRVQWLMGK